MIIHLPTIITGISTKVDGSIKISLETRELPPQEAADLFSLRNQEIWSLLSPNQISSSEIPKEEPNTEILNKTPSQRLRAVMYILWKQKGGQGDYESFYRSNMEKIIEQIKERLE